MKLSIDSEKILNELNDLKNPGKSCYRNAKKKKVSIINDYFSEEMATRLKEFFGDAMSIYESDFPKEYCTLLSKYKNINILRVCPRYPQEADNELNILSHLREVDEVVDLKNIEDLRDFDFNIEKAYIIFVFDKISYIKSVDFLKDTKKRENIDIYPLHRSLYGYKDYVYDLNKKSKIDILDFFKNIKSVLIVYDKNAINLNYIFLYLQDQNVELGVYGNINETTKKIIDEKKVAFHTKISTISVEKYDSILINSQEARCVYVLARRLNKKYSEKNIYSYHPLFEYKRPTLKQQIEGKRL